MGCKCAKAKSKWTKKDLGQVPASKTVLENRNERGIKYKEIRSLYPKCAFLALRTELFWKISENTECLTPRWKSSP